MNKRKIRKREIEEHSNIMSPTFFLSFCEKNEMYKGEKFHFRLSSSYNGYVTMVENLIKLVVTHQVTCIFTRIYSY